MYFRILLVIIAIVVLGRVTDRIPPCKDPVTMVAIIARGVDPQEYGDVRGIKYVGPVSGVESAHEYEVACATGHPRGYEGAAEDFDTQTRRFANRDEESQGITVWKGVQYRRQRYPRSLASPILPDVWHLSESPSASNAITHVRKAWDSGYNGSGTLIIVVDDGLEWRHIDIRPRFYAPASANYCPDRSSLTDCTPTGRSRHGTGCAGLAAAAGRAEGMPCIRGVAFGARIAGVRLIELPATDANEARALSQNSSIATVYSCSWGPYDDGLQLEGPGPLGRISMATAGRMGRNGRGCLIVWACGNGRPQGDSCAYDGYCQHRSAIAVAAVTHLGKVAPYSEFCPAVFICAPSSGDSVGITTTDLPIDGEIGCRDNFGGTSAATPYVAGVIALITGANPDLSSRDVAEILAVTAQKVDPTDPSWVMNGAGYSYSTHYGFGLVDAYAAVKLAIRTVPHLPSEFTVRKEVATRCGTVTSVRSNIEASLDSPVSDEHSLPCLVPNTKSSATVSWVPITDANLVVERVEITVDINHRHRGELAFELASPAGTRMPIIARPRDIKGDYKSWTFSFVGYRGEQARGRWALLIKDTLPENRFSGELVGWELTILS
jgi:kexin